MDQALGRSLGRVPTPMEETLRSKPGDTSLLGVGRRVPTLRSQVHAVQRFLKWLWEIHRVLSSSSSRATGGLHLLHRFGLQVVPAYAVRGRLRREHPQVRAALRNHPWLLSSWEELIMEPRLLLLPWWDGLQRKWQGSFLVPVIQCLASCSFLGVF